MIYPARLSEGKNDRVIHLLLMEEIQNRFAEGINNRYRKVSGKKWIQRIMLCRGCLKPISDRNERHRLICIEMGKEAISVPKKDTYQFNKFYAHMDVQYKIIFHIMQYTNSNSRVAIFERHYQFTNRNNTTNVAGYSVIVLKSGWKVNKQECYFGEDAMENLMDFIFTQSKAIIQEVKDTYIHLTVTEEMKRHKQNADNCPLCQNKFNSTNRLPAFNHTHHNGLFHSLISVSCNILAVKKELVCISHNYGSVDGFLMLRNLKEKWLRKIKLVAKTHEKLLSMT
jgi:hypothetical protein